MSDVVLHFQSHYWDDLHNSRCHCGQHRRQRYSGFRIPAGSGKGKEDLKPFNEAKGGMINDVISNIDVGDRMTRSDGQREIIKIRCRNCDSLNDEDARFCKSCGREI